MSNRLTVKGKGIFLLLWIGASILGWFLAPINSLDPNLRNYLDVANRAAAYAACGLMTGLVIAIGQSLVLKRELHSAKKWFFLTLAGYALAWPVGLAISTLIPTIAFPLQGESFLPLSGSSTTSFFPFPMDLIFGAWVVGAAQWMALRSNLPSRNSRLAAVWILGVWLSIGLGIFVALLGRTAPINSGIFFDPTLAFERAKIGLVSGLVTGLLTLFVFRQAGEAEKIPSAVAENIEVH